MYLYLILIYNIHTYIHTLSGIVELKVNNKVNFYLNKIKFSKWKYTIFKDSLKFLKEKTPKIKYLVLNLMQKCKSLTWTFLKIVNSF